jgi:hypothetical protein
MNAPFDAHVYTHEFGATQLSHFARPVVTGLCRHSDPISLLEEEMPGKAKGGAFGQIEGEYLAH